MAGFLDKVKSIGSLPSKIKATSKKAADWFRNKIKELSAGRINNPVKFLKSRDYDRVSRPLIGRMYSFEYDAKHKKTLPYWDQYPLIICVGYDGSKYFYGLNLHYIKPKHRAQLLSALMETATDKTLGEDAKLKISYQMLKAAAKFGMYKPTLKMYLYSHVKSPFLRISPDDWLLVAFLPTQKFHKSSAENVWADSMTMY